ncbi:30S ribosomal protein S9 [Pelagicoccus sp. SDUM812003]|uniref:30S ribosomal protein S9 n=1 Tax=Pelagicoccus sp. SDUM812003 TaxID=3041267 RepID=UPI00280CF65B|nr:30S ribosomal protein S9 [Pelagicoccus sp. SDUM812003]MDQ8204197.1 30S ribosomal protein S9 [Pelagicoccus sp. SDUM812003]
MSVESNVFLGTGRRKTAVARVRLQEGSGKIVVNGKESESFFSHENFQRIALSPLATAELKDKVDIVAKVQGGGDSGQAGAISLGIARALLKLDAELRAPLKQAGLLTRDPRMKERKKAGQPGARKKFQFSKR